MSSDISRGVIEALKKRIENLEIRLEFSINSENALLAENHKLKTENAKLESLLSGRKSIVRDIRRGPSLK